MQYYKAIIFSDNLPVKKYRNIGEGQGLRNLQNYIKSIDPGYKYMNLYNQQKKYVRRIYSTDII